MLTLTRIVATLYVAATAVASQFLPAVSVAAVSGGIFTVATFLVSTIPAGRTDWLGWIDAIAAGFAVNATAKTTGAAAKP